MSNRNEIEHIFQKELTSFEGTDDSIKEFVFKIMENLPDYFLNQKSEGTDNDIIIHTKTSLAFANSLFVLESFQEKFMVSERNIIRAALFLHDGFLYGVEKQDSPCHDHPEIMGLYIRSKAWDNVLVSFFREDIARLVECHSGQWNKKKGCIELKKPSSEDEYFVHFCTYLASRKETTLDLPLVSTYYHAKIKKTDDDEKSSKIQPSTDQQISLELASVIVKQMIQNKTWNGFVYYDDEGCFVLLNEQKVPVAESLREAFQIIGQAIISQKVLTWDEFLIQYPKWNYFVYGTSGNLYFVYEDQNIYISNKQADALGINYPKD